MFAGNSLKPRHHSSPMKFEFSVKISMQGIRPKRSPSDFPTLGLQPSISPSSIKDEQLSVSLRITDIFDRTAGPTSISVP